MTSMDAQWWTFLLALIAPAALLWQQRNDQRASECAAMIDRVGSLSRSRFDHVTALVEEGVVFLGTQNAELVSRISMARERALGVDARTSDASGFRWAEATSIHSRLTLHCRASTADAFWAAVTDLEGLLEFARRTRQEANPERVKRLDEMVIEAQASRIQFIESAHDDLAAYMRLSIVDAGRVKKSRRASREEP